MTPLLSITAAALLAVPCPQPPRRLEHRLLLELPVPRPTTGAADTEDAGSVRGDGTVCVRVPAAAAVAVRADGEVQVWRQAAADDGRAVAEVSEPLRAGPGFHYWLASPTGSGTYRLAARSNDRSDASDALEVVLTRVDVGGLGADRHALDPFRTDLRAWAEAPPGTPPPVPRTADTALRRELTELRLLAAALDAAAVPPDRAAPVLRAAVEITLSRRQSLGGPWLQRHALDLGGPSAQHVPPGRRKPRTYRLLSAGETLNGTAPAGSVLRLRVQAAPSVPCSRGLAHLGSEPAVAVTGNCAGVTGTSSILVQRLVLAETAMHVSAEHGALLVRAVVAERRPALTHWLTPGARSSGTSDLDDYARAPAHPSTADRLLRAEALRLQGRADDARQAFAQVLNSPRGDEPPPASYLMTYAVWRRAQLEPAPEAAAAALLGAPELPCADPHPCAELHRIAHREAVARLVDAGDPDSLERAQTVAEQARLPPGLAQRLLVAQGASFSADWVGSALTRQWHAQPHRTDLGRDVRRHLQRNTRWQPLPLHSGEPRLFVDRAAHEHVEPPGNGLVAAPEEGAAVAVPADPLAAGRLRRVRLVLQARPTDAGFARLHVAGSTFTVPLLHPVSTWRFALSPGVHPVRAEGARLLVAISDLQRPEAAEASPVHHRLRAYHAVGSEADQGARVPDMAPHGRIRLAMRLDRLADDGTASNASLQVCMDDACQRVRLHRTAGGPQTAPVLFEIPVAGPFERLRLRRLDPGPGDLWLRAWAQVRRTAAEDAPAMGPPPSRETVATALRSTAAAEAEAGETVPEPASPPLETLELALAQRPNDWRLLTERAKVRLRAGRLAGARADLLAAVRAARPAAGTGAAPAAVLLRALGPRGAWTRACDAATTPVCALDVAPVLPPGPSERRAVDLALQAGRRTDHAACQSMLQQATELGAAEAPMATFLHAELEAESAPTRAADELTRLAQTLTSSDVRARLHAKAARIRLLQQEDPTQRLLAHAQAVLAGSAPGAITARRLARQRTEWQRVPYLERSAGRIKLRRADRRLSAHSTNARQPATLTVRGPTVLRLHLHGVLDDRAPTGARVTVDERMLAEASLPTAPSPTLAPDAGLRAAVSQGVRLEVPILEPGLHTVAIVPDRGDALVRVAVRTTSTRSADPTERPLAEPTTEAPPGWLTRLGFSDAAEPPATDTTAHGLAPSVRLQRPSQAAGETRLPFTVSASTGLHSRRRDEEDPHSHTDPRVPVAVVLHRKLGRALWASGGPRLHLHAGAPTTAGARVRLDAGSGTGGRLSLLGEGYTQGLASGRAWSARLRARAGWEHLLLPTLRVRGELSLFARQLSAHSMPSGATLVDPAVYSSYGRDHLRGATARALATWRPAADLRVRAHASVTANAAFDTLDRYRVGTEALALVGPIYGRVGLDHERRLPDRHRYLPTSTDWLETRVGLRLWVGRGERVAVELRGRLFLRERPAEAAAVVLYQRSFERGLDDVTPALLAFRPLLADAEPAATTRSRASKSPWGPAPAEAREEETE